MTLIARISAFITAVGTDIKTLYARAAPRVQSVTSASTVTPNVDTDDAIVITAQAATLTIANPAGTMKQAFGFLIRVTDNGTARAVSFGNKYRGIGVTLITTTVAGKITYISCICNTTDDKIDVTGITTQA